MTEETRIVEEVIAADVAAVVDAAEAETTPTAVAEAAVEMAVDAAAELGEKAAGAVADVAESVSAVTETVVETASESVAAVNEAVAEQATGLVQPAREAEDAATGVSDDDDADDSAAGGDRKVVRLSVGQAVQGIVKRITDFGAFVDIGAGRDGLIHISEMAVGRVNQVSDVVQVGQELTLWIKKLDRARNRISLTLISPETKTIKDINEGDVVPGSVTRIVPYGAFIDIGVGTDALLHVREMSNNYVAKPEDVVQAGEQLDVRVVSVNRRRRRIDVSLKGLREEPEPEVVEVAEAAASLGVEADEEIVDPYENVEVLSPMELAFKRAMEAEGIEVSTSPSSRRRGGRSKRSRAVQEEIIRRTLETMRE